MSYTSAWLDRVNGCVAAIKGRLKRHDNRNEGWTYYSFFEVHDNITREDIREPENLFSSALI
jgi:hypothetical protein